MKKLFKTMFIVFGGGFIILGIVKLFELIKEKKG